MTKSLDDPSLMTDITGEYTQETRESTTEELDLDGVLKHYIEEQVKKTMAKPSRKEQSQRRKMEATICTQTDNAIDAPSKNHRSDKIVHHHNIEGLQGIYLEQPEVDGYTYDNFNEAWKMIIGYARTDFSEALAKSIEEEKDMASESYIPPVAPGPYATEREKRIDTIMLKEHVKDLTTFRRHKQKFFGIIMVITSPNFRDALEADNRFDKAKAKSNLFVMN